MEMRRQISLKSEAYPESRCVDGARMSVEVCAHYPGRSRVLPMATAVERRRDGAREVSRGHSRRGDAPKVRRRSEADSPSYR
jgi:hypothetical protein